ncbi:RNA degradosome polyphosphate kinase [Sphingomicrobium astaxanthinifaciens]|uniref:RNA degradosome polyphosphate kinase n=1 Tax=Sphingomicrobium astaxanthinifaciens TaxID=1227949 RepID=UPI001FCA82AC|nr:RNA degradosome polyphosphate kinase [Sphingomicrobium astaxanthinifaciens]MCJ7422225.1 RNA degradosome polyphosphate kinase [Sphingomicrobium astaxanthinifaciens]
MSEADPQVDETAGADAAARLEGFGPDRFFNRETSWLAFNRRVLEEAANPAHPLLERLRFLAIAGSNLDEFFMVRVAGLKGQQLQGIEEYSIDGRTPGQQLEEIAGAADALTAAAQALWVDLRAQLEAAGLDVIHRGELTPEERDYLAQRFDAEILPVVTPQVVDGVNPFPFVANAGFGLIFDLHDRKTGEELVELLMIPPSLPRFMELPGNGAGTRVIAIESVIREFFGRLFPGFEKRAAGAFRVLRDSDIEIEEEAEDLVLTFRSAIKRRRRGRIIRLELAADTPDGLEDVVREGLGAHNALIVETSGMIGMADLAQVVEVDRPDLKFEPYNPRFPERIKEYGGDCFAAIRAKDIVVHHPYEAFDVVVSFLRQAAQDPDVVAIKMALYRAGKQSEIIEALATAAEAGKSVTAVVELKARFDEEQNLLWAARLERAGVQVVYGFFEWKTHAKVAMVVRREGEKMRTYTHWGTGNYHPVTSRIYTDLSFFTASTRAARDAAKMFNLVTGFVRPRGLELATFSPAGLRARILKLIDREIEHAQAGRPAAIWAKMNQLVDREVIDRLYAASMAGVSIELVVRGICCLRPGVEGLSENIRVKSIVGRFLEHSRIFVFANGERLPHDKARVYISSADWMPRNFDRRVEYMLPLENPTVHAQVLEQVMIANLIDNEQSWVLREDGEYERLQPGKRRFNCHHYFMNNPSLSGRGAALAGKKIPKLKLTQRGG